MCFNRSILYPFKRKARKHKLVYKGLEQNRWATKRGSVQEDYIAPYRGTKYEFGKLYDAVFTSQGKSIYAGLHSFRGKRIAHKELGWMPGHDIFPAIIPKGSAYYTNFNEVVSEQLIVFRNMDELNKWKEENK